MRGLITLTAVILLSVLLNVLVFSSSAFATVRDWDSTDLGQKDVLERALGNLQKQNSSSAVNQSENQNIQLTGFTKGALYYHQGKYEEAIAPLQESLRGNFLLDDYSHYFLGLNYIRLQKWDEAYKAFDSVSSDKNAGPRKFSAIYRMGEIALVQNKLSLAERHFAYLERRIRSSEKYPYVLYNLAKLMASGKNTYKACSYVRKLYSKFPTHELTADWTLDLKNVSLDGVKPKCLATLNEQKTRIRNLQYGGDSPRARNEILALYKNTNDVTKYFIDIIYARFLIDDGEVDEALAILMPYYTQRTGDIAYHMLLAKAASRKGDNLLAINSYTRAHRMKPRSSVGREALFQAAFVGYLGQDYDGALTRFQDYKKMYGGKNGMAASWYVSWIKYLKGDYKGAYDDFSKFGKMKFSKKMRNTYFDPGKINYWKAVSLLKMGQVQQGIAQLSKIAADPSKGFYALSAQARVAVFKQQNPSRQITGLDEKNSKVVGQTDLTPLSLIAPSLSALESGGNSLQSAIPDQTMETEEEILADAKSEGDSAEDVESTDDEEDAESGEEKTAEEAGGDTDTVAEAEIIEKEDSEMPLDVVSTFKDPRLSVRFQRAEALRSLGFEEWSNRELQFIEARTRNRSYLQTLIEKYEQGGDYNRSAYIAETYYESDRKKSFPQGYGWKKSFPRAYEKFVSASSEKLQVPKEFIWGIMRTESFFRPKVKSSVGALGLMQLMPLTGQKMAESLGVGGFKVEKLLEAETNVLLGTRYLQRLSKMFNGQWPLVAAGYNAGPHRVYSWLKNFGNLQVDEFIEHIPYSQTRGYVKKVIRTYHVYGSTHGGKGTSSSSNLNWLAENIAMTYSGSVPTKETWEDL